MISAVENPAVANTTRVSGILSLPGVSGSPTFCLEVPNRSLISAVRLLFFFGHVIPPIVKTFVPAAVTTLLIPLPLVMSDRGMITTASGPPRGEFLSSVARFFLRTMPESNAGF